MKHFLYLDNDLVDSIIAQDNKYIITGVSESQDIKREDFTAERVNNNVKAEMKVGIASLLTGNINAGLEGALENSGRNIVSDSKVVTKILHDAAFDIAYDAINPNDISNSEPINAYGEYISLKRVFNIVDFEELESLLGENGLLDYKERLDASEAEKLVKDKVSEASNSMNKENLKSYNRKLRSEMNAIAEENKRQYDCFVQTINILRKIIPYNRILVSYDGYMVSLDDQYFRINAKSMGIKYGGELTVVGLITNIIGEDCEADEDNVFTVLQNNINRMLIEMLPIKEKTIYVVQPIAVYYE